MSEPARLVVPAELHDRLFRHLFPGDEDEHGAVIAAGVAAGPRGVRLLARDVVLARDGVDYVPGQRGYRMLTADFVLQNIRKCRDERLCYLAVHNHGGTDSVTFSNVDLASHERGYPALLEIAAGMPVGGLVMARNAVAGDIWLSQDERVALGETRVIGPRMRTLWPGPQRGGSMVDEAYDRQARLFGDAGQRVLRGLKVGVIGAGGAGSLIVQYLAHLGVGHLIVVDPDRLDITNLPRVVGATRFDARTWLTAGGRPDWMRAVGRRIAARKVDVAARVARTANPRGRVERVFADFTDTAVATRFLECDFLFLAADSFQARLVFNALVQQYLIPGVQVGVKVTVDRRSGKVAEVRGAVRPVVPGSGCLWCNGLIPPGRLEEEAAGPEEVRARAYVDEPTVIAPSVITLNAQVAAHACNDFLFMMTGLMDDDATLEYLRITPPRRRISMERPRRDPDCLMCGAGASSRRARGAGVRLPTRERSGSAAAG